MITKFYNIALSNKNPLERLLFEEYGTSASLVITKQKSVKQTKNLLFVSYKSSFFVASEVIFIKDFLIKSSCTLQICYCSYCHQRKQKFLKYHMPSVLNITMSEKMSVIRYQHACIQIYRNCYIHTFVSINILIYMIFIYIYIK